MSGDVLEQLTPVTVLSCSASRCTGFHPSCGKAIYTHIISVLGTKPKEPGQHSMFGAPACLYHSERYIGNKLSQRWVFSPSRIELGLFFCHHSAKLAASHRGRMAVCKIMRERKLIDMREGQTCPMLVNARTKTFPSSQETATLLLSCPMKTTSVHLRSNLMSRGREGQQNFRWIHSIPRSQHTFKTPSTVWQNTGVS